MSRKIYLNTNIYLDYLLERTNRYGDDRSACAFLVFHRTFLCEFDIVLSDWCAEELLHTIQPDQVLFLMELLKAKKKLFLVKCSESDREYAKTLSSHYQDPLHAILAKKGDAEFIVTRDKKGFTCCKHILEAYLPEEI